MEITTVYNVKGSEDPDKKITVSKYKTFCSLCNHAINADEECYTWQGNKFLMHLDCTTARSRETRMQFLKETKIRKPKHRSGARGVNRGKLFYGK